MGSHYETLGLSPDASPDDVKASYRRLARQYHPDVNKEAGAEAKFLEIQKAYEVLSDVRRREAYDQIIGFQRKAEDQREREARQRTKEEREAEELRRIAEERMRDAPTSAKVDQAETERLLGLMQANKFAEAEVLARQMLERESRQPVPYAVLGDIARFRGETQRAIEFFGYAAQYEPRNTVYQRKYEELVSGNTVNQKVNTTTHLPDPEMPPLLVASALVIVMACYVAIAPEKPLGLPLVPRWTLGSLVMGLLSGLGMGVGLRLSGLLDNFKASTSTTVAKLSPAMLVAFVSVVSFWLASGYYFVLGQTQQTFNRSLSCLIGSTVAVVVVFTLAGLAKGPEFAVQNLVWSGNIVFLASFFGWSITDSVRR